MKNRNEDDYVCCAKRIKKAKKEMPRSSMSPFSASAV